jgi:hypothetical protein
MSAQNINNGYAYFDFFTLQYSNIFQSSIFHSLLLNKEPDHSDSSLVSAYKIFTTAYFSSI